MWNFLQAEIVPDDRMIRPMIGPGSLTRDQAHAEVQALLDRLGAVSPAMRQAATTWKRGARDDTVYAEVFTWTIYQHPDGQDPRQAAHAWLEDWAQTIRAAGIPDVQVARLPE